MATVTPRRQALRSLGVPALLLVGSGFSALVYQVLWLRLLGIVFGVTVHAASTVLASFMAGLALGSFVSGRLSDRLASPVRWFAWAELLIGVTALSTPWLLGGLELAYPQLHAAGAGDLRVLTLLRFVWSFLVLLVPTTLMGATLPLVLRAAVARSREVGNRAAALYAANTAGAVSGAIATGYFLVGQVGITTAFRTAAAINLAVALVAFLWSRTAPARSSAETAADGEDGGVGWPQATRTLVLGVAGLSGFVGLALEIIWFRALVIFVPATTYVFTLILAVVLGGIAAGSAMVARSLRRDGDWVARLAICQIATAVAATGSLAAQGWTYAQGWRTSAAMQASALSVLPTTLLMGAAFPIALYLWTARREDGARRAGDRVGRFYLANLSGAIAGAVSAGFLLIPGLGIRRALIAVAGLSLIAGLALLSAVAPRRRAFASATAAAGLAMFGGAAAALADPLEVVLARRYAGERVLWREEGAQATVSVHAGEHRVMYLDGLHQANDSPEMVATHRQIGTLAMALRPDARDALVIGLGGGVTAGAVAQFPQAAVQVVELSPSVVRGAEWFRHANGDVLNQPNVRIRVDDGRNYLLTTRTRYDVITADIIQPFHAGAGNLYSLDYFELARRALRDDGLMLQWVGDRPESQYRLIARTFLSAFPHTTAWAGGTLLVGTTRPLTLSDARYRERFADPRFAAALRSVGIASFEDLLRRYTAGADELRRFIGEGPVLTDDRPMIEFFLSLPRNEPQVELNGLAGDVRRHVVP